jgi:DNA-binding MarR family transcriptional regulator
MARRRSARDSYADAARLRIALRSFARHTEEITQRHGLTAQRYMLLLLVKVAEDEGTVATVTSLVRPLQTTQSSVTQLVGGAVRSGLITRRGDIRDARRHYLHLTPEGSARLDLAFAELGPERARLAEVVAASSSAG